jgi:hypothetical protein
VGRHLLLSLCAAAAALAAGCTPEGGAAARGTAAADSAAAAHADLACARCHDGVRTERAVPAASTEGCLSCHRDGGPRNVSLGAVSLVHRAHAADSTLAAGCAACHTHADGGQELEVTTTGCALCHASGMDGLETGGCAACHKDPGHVALTSQAVPIEHTGLPWMGGECVRCHYDVGRPRTDVAAATCASCHRDAGAMMERGAGSDLHPSHTGVTCAGCHEEVDHRVVA